MHPCQPYSVQEDPQVGLKQDDSFLSTIDGFEVSYPHGFLIILTPWIIPSPMTLDNDCLLSSQRIPSSLEDDLLIKLMINGFTWKNLLNASCFLTAITLTLLFTIN